MPRARIAILFHRLGPYHVARLRAAAQLLPIVAIESSGVDATYAWEQVVGTGDFERVTLFERGDAQKLPKAEVVRQVALALDKIHPAVVVVPGWADTAALGALRWCMKHQVPAIVMSETTAWDEPRVAWKEWIKRRIISLTSAALVGGNPHADYLVKLGMPKDRIFLGYDAVDNGYFAAEAAKWQKLKAETLKAEIGDMRTEGGDQRTEVRGQRTEDRGHRAGQTGHLSTIHDPQPSGARQTATGSPKGEAGAPRQSAIPNYPYFLASNRFIAKKNLFRLLDAYAGYLNRDQRSEDRDQDENTDRPIMDSDVLQATNETSNPSTQAQPTSDLRPPTSDTWPLVMLGDGALKAQLLAHCAALGLHAIESAPWEAEEKAESGTERSEIDWSKATAPQGADRRAGSKLKAESGERESPPSSVLCPPSSVLCPPSSGTVYFPGFRQIDELPRFYAHAGAFVHASTTEQWGLVVNEAMACGLPVIVSNRVGCAQDLVQEGVNGFTFDPYDVEQLTQLMIKVSAFNFDPARRPAPCGAVALPQSISLRSVPLSAFGDASRAIIADWGPERFASGLQAAVDKALKVGPRRASLLQRMILRALLWR